MPGFLIVTTADLPEAYFLASFLETWGQVFALVNIVARPASNTLEVLTRLRRKRGALYVTDLLLARAMDALAVPAYRHLAPEGFGAFPEVDARVIRHIRSRHPTLDCTDPHAPEVLSYVRDFEPDYILLAGCPILKPSFYGLARHGALNRHLGVLPDFRGSDCAVWAFAQGKPESAGYSIHVVSERVDAGDVVFRRRVPVGDEPSLARYLKTLRREASKGFVEVIARVLQGAPLPSVPQDGKGRYYPPAGLSTRLQAHWNYQRYQNSRDANRPPSERLRSFAHTTPGSTAACPTQVPNPQSVPAITRSRPTSLA